MGNKERLFEIMGNVNPDFKKKKILNETSLHNDEETLDQAKFSGKRSFKDDEWKRLSANDFIEFKKEYGIPDEEWVNMSSDEKGKELNDFLELDENTDTSLNENEINPKYTHFAALKDGNKIVNGWEYNGYDSEDLKLGKKEYFFDDIIDMDINPKKIAIYTTKTLQRKGIDPFDTNNWYKFEAEGWRDKNDLN